MASTNPRPGPAAPAGPAAAGAMYGQYYLVRKLAEGGMAEIFLAKKRGAEGFEKNVVIKRMLRHLSDVPDFVRMFLDEARLAARLAHHNIIQIDELGEADGCYYICMEYLAGEDFSTVLRTAAKQRQYVPLNICAKVIIEAANGLHFAHEFTDENGARLNVVHRDISPSNIYVTYNGQVKVLDFGIAKAESRLTQTTAGVVKGKYMYMAPEQARGETVDRRADIFSLGVSLYESLTLTRPFAKENDLAILNAVLKNEFKKPREVRPDLPVELEAVVLKAMAKSSAERYQTAAEMSADLVKFLGTFTTTSGLQLGAYMTSLFGEQRKDTKMRIPALATLLPANTPSPSGSGSYPPPLHTPTDVRTVASKAVTVEGLRAPAARKGSIWRTLGIAAGIVVLAGAGSMGAISLVLHKQLFPPPAPPVTTPAPVAVASAPQPAPVAAKPNLPGPTPAPAVASPTPPPTPAEPAPEPRRHLSVSDVEKVIARGRGNIQSCFVRYRSQLPSQQSEVQVHITIFGSGKVAAETQGTMSHTPVGNCLEQQVKRLRFPAHRDRELSFMLPLSYREL